MSNLALVRASVKEWSTRRNIADNIIDVFINIALDRANWALRVPSLEAYASISINGEGYLQIPTDFIEVKELSVDLDQFTKILDRKSISEVDSLVNLEKTQGYPEVFARFGNYFKIAPWFYGTLYSANLYYYKAEPTMIQDGDTNWFSSFAPQVLLYGALQELCDYTRDSDGAMLWKGKFEGEINILQAVEDRSMWNGSTLAVSRNGSIRGRSSV
jgi:hypothetical protein